MAIDELAAPGKFSQRDHWRLLPILVIAALLRLWQINESLWLDELHSAWVVSDGVGQIAERAQMGNQSPLYFYLPWATTSLFGMSEWALRLPSLVAGVGLVLLAYWLAYEFTRSRIAAITCATLAATDHNFLFYATEARPYAYVQLFAAVQLLLIWRLQSCASAGRHAGFVIASAVLFYLHYTAILLLAGEIAFVLVRACCRRGSRLASQYAARTLAVDLLCIAVLIVPTIASLFDIGSRRGTWASFVNETSLMLSVHWFSLVSYVVVPLIVCLLVGVIKVAITLRRDEPFTLDSVLRTTSDSDPNTAPLDASRRSVTTTLLLLFWLGVPLAIVWLLTVKKIAPLYLGRYVIGAALAPVLFAGLGIGVWRTKRSQILVACIVIAYAVFHSGMVEQFRFDGRLIRDRAENWRAAVRYVNANEWAPNSPVFVRSGLLEADRLATDESNLLREYCVLPVTSIYRIDRPAGEIRPLTTRTAGQLTNAGVKRIQETKEAWFIINGDSATVGRCRDRVVTSIASASHVGVVLESRQFGNVGVFLLALGIIDGHDEPAIVQPTSPNSIAPP